jgi:hypothetical protein
MSLVGPRAPLSHELGLSDPSCHYERGVKRNSHTRATRVHVLPQHLLCRHETEGE